MSSKGKFSKAELDQMRIAADNKFAANPDLKLIAQAGVVHLGDKSRSPKDLSAVETSGADIIKLDVIHQDDSRLDREPSSVRRQAGYVVVSLNLDHACIRLEDSEAPVSHAFDPSTVQSYLGGYDEAGFRTTANAVEDAELFVSRKHAMNAATIATGKDVNGPAWQVVKAKELTTANAWIRVADSGLGTGMSL